MRRWSIDLVLKLKAHIVHSPNPSFFLLDPSDAADVVNELPQPLYEEELVQMILEQVGIIVFRAVEVNGAYYEQVGIGRLA